MLVREYFLMYKIENLQMNGLNKDIIENIINSMYSYKNTFKKKVAFYDFFFINNQLKSSRIEHDIEYFIKMEYMLKDYSLTEKGQYVLKEGKDHNKTFKTLIDLISKNNNHRIFIEKAKKNIQNDEKIFTNSDTIAFLYGYEKKSLDFLLNYIIQNQIDLIVDVRYNPSSMNFEFNKTYIANTINKYLPKTQYINIKTLGIPTSIRKELKMNNNIQSILKYYSTNILKEQEDELFRFIDLLRHKRSLIMCKEDSFINCHRSVLGKIMEQNDIIVHWG